MLYALSMKQSRNWRTFGPMNGNHLQNFIKIHIQLDLDINCYWLRFGIYRPTGNTIMLCFSGYYDISRNDARNFIKLQIKLYLVYITQYICCVFSNSVINITRHLLQEIAPNLKLAYYENYANTLASINIYGRCYAMI